MEQSMNSDPLLAHCENDFVDYDDLQSPVPLDSISGDPLRLLTKIQSWLPDPKASNTRLFLNWQAALQQGFNTVNNWKLADRKPNNGEKPTAFYIQVEPYSAENTYRKPLRLCGNDYHVLKKIPLYHETQTRPAKIRATTKAYIRFAKLFRFDPNRHVVEYGNGKRATITADPDEFLYENRNYFDLTKIKEHLSGKSIYSGFASGTTKLVYLDIDFHEANDKCVFLQVVNMILDELPVLMVELEGNALHHQVADANARGIHCGFVLKERQNWREVYDQVKDWLRRLDVTHANLLKEAVERRALPFIDPQKPNSHTFTKIEVYFNDFQALRLPLCRGRTMLLDNPLPLLPNGKQDVVGFMDYLENPRPPMAAAEVVTYLSDRLTEKKPAVLHSLIPSDTKQKHSKESLDSEKLVWKNRYRQNLVQFWLGIRCPQGSLDEVIGAHARIAPYFTTEETAINILQEFVRELPEDARECSSRLLKQDFGRIDKNIKYAVQKAFAGNLNQPDAVKSNNKLKQIAKRFKQLGFDPFDKSTWHKNYTQFKVEIDWSENDLLIFRQSLKPLFGKAQNVDPAFLVNKVIALVLSKEKEKNGIALPYWKCFFEDQFGIACGCRGERRHQLLVQMLERLMIIRVYQGQMFGGGRNLGRRFALGQRVQEKPGWEAKQMSKAEMLREVMQCNML